MTELVVLISEFGLPVIVGATVLYLLLCGEIHFSYHRGFGGCGTGLPGSYQGRRSRCSLARESSRPGSPARARGPLPRHTVPGWRDRRAVVALLRVLGYGRNPDARSPHHCPPASRLTGRRRLWRAGAGGSQKWGKGGVKRERFRETAGREPQRTDAPAPSSSSVEVGVERRSDPDKHWPNSSFPQRLPPLSATLPSPSAPGCAIPTRPRKPTPPFATTGISASNGRW